MSSDPAMGTMPWPAAKQHPHNQDEQMAMPAHGVKVRRAARQFPNHQDETPARPSHGVMPKKKRDPEDFHGGM